MVLPLERKYPHGLELQNEILLSREIWFVMGSPIDELFKTLYCPCQTSWVNLCEELFSIYLCEEHINYVGKVKLWGLSKIIEPPIVYNFLSCNVRDMFWVSLLETSSSMLGDKFYHKWNCHKMTSWVPWKWHWSDLIPKNRWKHIIMVKNYCHKYYFLKPCVFEILLNNIERVFCKWYLE